MKKIISTALICAMITGCSAHREGYEDLNATSVESEASSEALEESVSGDGFHEVSDAAGAADSAADDSEASKATSVSESAGNDSEAAVADDTSTVEENKTNGAEITVSESNDDTLQEDSKPAEEPVISEPQWSETKCEGTRYINTNGVYSRKIAVVGSEAVKKYGVNDKVSVIAVTDTGYYKLDDGTFIHRDYLAGEEVKVVEKPVTPSSAQNGNAETLLNSAALIPMKTNNDTVDAQVAEILKKVTTDKMSTYQKVKAVYDYIISTSTYGTPKGVYGFENYDSKLDNTIVLESRFLLDEGVGVCNNYAALFTVLTRRIGLESYYVTGQVASRNGGMTGHAWSIIKLSGEYYIFDTQIEHSNSSGGKIGYNWFCKKDTLMSGTYSYIPNRDDSVSSFGGFKLAEIEYPDVDGKITPIEDGYIIEYENGVTETVHFGGGMSHDIDSILDKFGISRAN